LKYALHLIIHPWQGLQFVINIKALLTELNLIYAFGTVENTSCNVLEFRRRRAICGRPAIVFGLGCVTKIYAQITFAVGPAAQMAAHLSVQNIVHIRQNLDGQGIKVVIDKRGVNRCICESRFERFDPEWVTVGINTATRPAPTILSPAPSKVEKARQPISIPNTSSVRSVTSSGTTTVKLESLLTFWSWAKTGLVVQMTLTAVKTIDLRRMGPPKDRDQSRGS
jgi:hypothetical protein